MKRQIESGLVVRKDSLPRLPRSTSVWGEYDVLNSRASSLETTHRVKEVIDHVGVADGFWIAQRASATVGSYQLPLRAFGFNPEALGTKIDDMVTAIAGPLSYAEAIAGGYISETAVLTRDLVKGEVLSVAKGSKNVEFEEVARFLGGERRFLPLGWSLFYDYLSRMARLRYIADGVPRLDEQESDEEFLGRIVGPGVVPLAKAFQEDGDKIGDQFQDELDRTYVGNRRLFIPFAGIGGEPKTAGDWKAVGLGLFTSVRLFRRIEEEVGKKSPPKVGQD